MTDVMQALRRIFAYGRKVSQKPLLSPSLGQDGGYKMAMVSQPKGVGRRNCSTAIELVKDS